MITTGTGKFDYRHGCLLKRDSVSQYYWQSFEGLKVYAKIPIYYNSIYKTIDKSHM